jgi:phosphoribosylformylglycinamidine synthase subunit PurQ / glutaminase
MKTAVIIFPGSNCDRDAMSSVQAMCAGAWGEGVSGSVVRVWHRDTALPKVDAVVLPGGFSYGDYLRSGAMSARSPIMEQVRAHAHAGGYVLGICNGFQILTEAGLLDGALMRNRDLKFICRPVSLKVENNASAFTSRYAKGQIISVPVAHHDGNYRIDAEGLKRLQDGNQIAFRYAHIDGRVDDAANINGSVDNIAGVLNAKGNVLGMMPHPERVCDALTGGTDGRGLFLSLNARAA